MVGAVVSITSVITVIVIFAKALAKAIRNL